MKEEIEVLLDDYEEHMKLHRMKVTKATAATLVCAGKAIVDFLRHNWVGLAGELAILPFSVQEWKISLTEVERAPNKELAFISMAKERFSR